MHERVNSRFLVLPGSESTITEITEYTYFSPLKPFREFQYKKWVKHCTIGSYYWTHFVFMIHNIYILLHAYSEGEWDAGVENKNTQNTQNNLNKWKLGEPSVYLKPVEQTLYTTAVPT